jgi:hypothetical protein
MLKKSFMSLCSQAKLKQYDKWDEEIWNAQHMEGLEEQVENRQNDLYED